MSGNKESVFNSSWPVFNEEFVIDSEIEIGVQVNGKLRGSILIAKDLDKECVLSKAKENDNVRKYVSKENLVKEIYVPGKIINFVVKS